MRGHVEIVNALLQQGADRNIRNKQDSLPVRFDETRKRCVRQSASLTAVLRSRRSTCASRCGA
jgi:hypothetical protein